MTRARLVAWLLVLAPAPLAAAPFIAYRAEGDVSVFDLATHARTNLTNHPAADTAPSWAGNGRQIAFWSNRNGHANIYTMDADGANVQQRTRTARGKGGTAFSPNGRYIAYPLWSDPDGVSPIAVVDLRTNVEQIVTAGTGVADIVVSWFPDSERVLFSRRGAGHGIHFSRLDVAGDDDFVVYGYHPSMGPDGRSVAYRPTNWFGADNEIHVHDMATGRSKLVPIELPDPQQPITPTWAGEDRLLVEDTADDVYLVDVATGRHTALPLQGWVRWFDPRRPLPVSARGRKPYSWGWLKTLGATGR